MAKNQNTSGEGTQVYVATQSAHIEVDGRRQVISKGVTRVAAGHDILKRYPDLFKPAEQDVRFGVEDAVARPASTGGTQQQTRAEDLPSEPVKPYSEWKKTDLEKEVKSRNHRRKDDDKIVVKGRGTIADLAEALATDDATPVETGVLLPEGAEGDGTVVSDKTKSGIHPDELNPGVAEAGEGAVADGTGTGDAAS